MLIGENARRSDARVLYGILAQSALSQFDAPDHPHRNVYFQNLLTLLEMYQYHALGRPSHRAVLDRREVTRKEFELEKLEAEQVEAALVTAHKAVFQNLSREQLVQHLRAIFVQVSKGLPVDNQNILTAKEFLTVFRHSLRK